MSEEQLTNSAQSGVRAPLEWEAHEYVHVEKTPEWFWALGLIATAGAVAAVMYNNVLFAVLILLIAFVLALFAHRQPNVVRFSVSQRGVKIDDTLYPYGSLESFAIAEVSPHHVPKLILESRKIFGPKLIIPIYDIDADEVHDFIARFLPEDDHIEPLSHRVLEWLGF